MTDLFDDEAPPGGDPDGSTTGWVRRISGRNADRTRTHHVVERDPSHPVDRDRDTVSLWTEDAWSRHARRPWHAVDDPELEVWIESFEDAPRRRQGGAGVDPLVLRLGAIVGAAVLITPVLLSVRDDSDQLRSERSSTAAVDDPAAVTAPSSRVPAPLSTELSGTANGRAAAGADRRRQEKKASDVTVSEDAVSEPTAPACAMEYDIVFGDYWIRIADAAGVGLDDLLATNAASTETPLYEGDEICLPEGATMPAPPPATTDPPTTPAPTEPPTTDAPPTDPPTTPAPTEPPTTDAPPTDPPTTPAPTEPPTTTPATQPPTPGSPEEIIRAVWPDDIEERALTIARRESSLDPRAYNGWCCYGLFQIYFDGNRRFLAERGITSAEQLYDAGTNVRVAYAMYQVSGWSPWASTDPGA